MTKHPHPESENTGKQQKIAVNAGAPPANPKVNIRTEENDPEKTGKTDEEDTAADCPDPTPDTEPESGAICDFQ
jgi:hypothetical protein